MSYKITQVEADAIRSVARRVSGYSHVRLDVGIREHLTDDTRPRNVNIALVSDLPTWEDTDLFDYQPWADFRKGVELTADGRGTVDIYVMTAPLFGGDAELLDNITAHFEGGRLARVTGTRIRASGMGSVSTPIVWTTEQEA